MNMPPALYSEWFGWSYTRVTGAWFLRNTMVGAPSPLVLRPSKNFLKNKMKPTNPNADTYVEKQRCNTYLSQFPANPLVEHTDLTRWGDTLVGHPCLTLLRYALVRHSCMTLWFDTLVWHSSETLLLDTLVRHFLLDTLPCHSCKTLLFNTLVGHLLLDTSYLTLFWDTLTWQSCETFLLDWHSSPTLLLDTLVRHSYLTLL